MMFLKSLVRYSLVSLLVGMGYHMLSTRPAIAAKEDSAVYEDNLTTSDGLRWGGPKLPYRKAVDIRDSLVNTPLGKVTADRYSASDDFVNLGDLLFGPYYSPTPGKTVFISLWGSKIEGCFVEMIVQHTPEGNDVDIKALMPTTLELGVGSQLLELPPQSTSQPKVFHQDYTYTRYNSKTQNSDTYSGTWYMTRNLFVVDSGIASILINAPISEVRVRLTMLDGRKILVPIRKETVSSWKAAYSYNPSCQSAEALAKQQQLSNQPLLGAFESYAGSAAQNEALDWLQRQIKPTALAEFGHNWRGEPFSAPNKRIQLSNAAKFYKQSRQQKAAVESLEKKIPDDILKTFLQKWN